VWEQGRECRVIEVENVPFYMSSIIVMILILVCVLLPTVIAYSEKKKNWNAIFALNLFLGWTVIGWIVAIVWASIKD
jgi:ABC-type tungstate transport system substrate-binding protein